MKTVSIHVIFTGGGERAYGYASSANCSNESWKTIDIFKIWHFLFSFHNLISFGHQIYQRLTEQFLVYLSTNVASQVLLLELFVTSHQFAISFVMLKKFPNVSKFIQMSLLIFWNIFWNFHVNTLESVFQHIHPSCLCHLLLWKNNPNTLKAHKRRFDNKILPTYTF